MRIETNGDDRASRLRPATAADLFDLIERRLFMGSNWLLTLQAWSMTTMYELWGGSLTYVQTIPDEKENVIYLRGANKNDEGALEISFSNTRRTGSVNLHYAAARFNKRPKAGRRLSIPAQFTKDPILGDVLKLDIGAAQSVPARSRDDEEDSETASAQEAAETKKPAVVPAAPAPSAPAAPAQAQTAPSPVAAAAAAKDGDLK